MNVVAFFGLTLLISAALVERQEGKIRKREVTSTADTSASKLSPELQSGLKVYEDFSCVVCHGKDGNHGAHNINSQTGEQVPPLTHVADSYTKSELIAKIRTGVPVEPKLDPNGPNPPLTMPAFANSISDQQMTCLIGYLLSLKPKGEDLGF